MIILQTVFALIGKLNLRKCEKNRVMCGINRIFNHNNDSGIREFKASS